jgi:hypothetical protein
MDFHSDLAQAIACEFTREGISFPKNADPAHLASRYLEMRIRRIEPVPRTVHFSDEIHDSLGTLARNSDPKSSAGAREAWGTVFYLRNLFATGGTVIPYLSGSVSNTETTDKLLWDYAIHHLHLSRNVGKNGFVQRADWLLFAIVADQDVFFVDVRPHTDPEKLLWMRQDLLAIVHSNWSELMASRVLHGVTGDTITDIEKRELRRKNVNLVHQIGGRAVAPLGYGTSTDGHSILCTFLADKLLHELEQQQQALLSQTDKFRAEKEMADDAEMEFQLVPKGKLDLSADVSTKLCSSDGFCGTLWRLGFAIIETNTRSLVV